MKYARVSDEVNRDPDVLDFLVYEVNKLYVSCNGGVHALEDVRVATAGYSPQLVLSGGRGRPRLDI